MTAVLAGVVLSLLAGRTHQRVEMWGHEGRLWLEAAQHSPAKPRPWINLGRQYALADRPGRAEDALSRAVVLSAPHRRQQVEGPMRTAAAARFNLAVLLAAQGRYGAALAHVAEIRDRRPGDVRLDNMERQWRTEQASGGPPPWRGF